MNNIDKINEIAALGDTISKALKNAKAQSSQFSRNYFERTVKDMCDTFYKINELHKTFIAKEQMEFLSNTLCKSRKEVDALLKPPHVRGDDSFLFFAKWKHNCNLNYIYSSRILLLSPLVLHKLTKEDGYNFVDFFGRGTIGGVLDYKGAMQSADSYVYEYIPHGQKSEIWGMWRRFVTFNEWNDTQVVLYYPYKDKNGVDYFITATRREIVHFVRNVLGGTHQDDNFKQKYRQNLKHFIENCEFGYDILLYSVIAISYEIQFSFERFLKDKCSPK